MSSQIQCVDNHKQALQSNNRCVLLQERSRLTNISASALLSQNTTKMRNITAHFANPFSLSEQLDEAGSPGDRWHTLADLLRMALESNRPMEQLQLALPSSPSGLALRQIMKHPGINKDELPGLCKITLNQAAIEIKRLKDADLISYVKCSGNRALFLSAVGRELLDNVDFLEGKHGCLQSHQRTRVV